MKKNKSAQALNAIRWGNKTDKEKKAHMQMMRDARARKLLAVSKTATVLQSVRLTQKQSNETKI